MLLDNGARAIVFLVIPALAAVGQIHVWVVFAVALLAGALAPATQIGVRLLIPALLPDHELEQGNAAYSLTMQLPIVFGPMLVGALISVWGVTPTLLVNAGSFVLMGWSLLAMPDIPREQEHKPSEDQAFTMRRWPPTVRAVLGLTTLFYFAYGPFEVAFPLFARKTLGADALSYGMLWSALGVGTLLGTLLVSILSRAGRLHTVLAWIMALWGSAMVLLAFTSTIPFALTAMFVGGVIWGPYTALETTLLQRSVAVQAQGRLFGLRTMLLGPAAPVGTALGGLLLLGMSAPSVLGLSGLACVLGAIVAWFWMRRQLMQAVAEPMCETT
jgi:predicted MFS family arabinose efflux permease